MKNLFLIVILLLGALHASAKSFKEAMAWRKESEKTPFYSSISWQRGLENLKNGLKERWDVVLSTPRTLKILSQNPSIEAYYAKK